MQRLLIVVLATLLAGCTADPGEVSGPDTTASRTNGDVAASSLPCPEQATALTSDAPSVTGDIDGDGRPDEVALADPVGDCPAGVVALVESELFVAPIEEEVSGPGLPRLVGLANIDGGSGAEIVVAIAAGASTEFFGLFGWTDGSLSRVEIEDGRFGSLLASGGSAAHLDATDCVDPGTLVVSTASPVGEDLRVVRRFYELEDGRLVPSRRERTVVPSDRIADFEEFTATPFGSCPAV